MKHFSTGTLTLQESYVVDRKAYAVYNLCREFEVPSSIRAPIRALHEALGDLSNAIEDADALEAEKELNAARAYYNEALELIKRRHELDLQWLVALLAKIEG
ncbi:VHS1026 protein [Vibrio phage 1]|nr:VHS1026 protein [Vibrio phage 1]